MIKYGIHARGERASNALQLEAQQRGWWPFSYRLLADLEDRYEPQDEALLERLYRSLAAGGGAWKITRMGRFRELDERLSAEVAARFGDLDRVTVHDAAASNGITSLELFHRLERDCSPVMDVSDRYDALWLVRSARGNWTVAFDAEGRALQVSGTRMVLPCDGPFPWRYPINGVLRHWLMKRVVPTAERRLTLSRASSVVDPGIRRVALFHPLCVKESKRNTAFRLRQHDLFDQAEGQYEVVRVMNALTPRHMTEDQVRTGISACSTSLVCGGLLILGRSPESKDDQTRATAYEWSGTALRPLWSMNGGYEWPQLVESSM